MPNEVTIVTKAEAGNGSGVARTGSNFAYRRDCPALVLLDYDTKGMPVEVAERIKNLGGLLACSRFGTPGPWIGRPRDPLVYQRRTCANRYGRGARRNRGRGVHGYVMIKDGTDAGGFYRRFTRKFLVAGLGWMIVGKGGQLLER